MKNKTALILTLVRSNNHGAVLQAYALQKVLKKQFGIDALLIDYEWRQPQSLIVYLKNPLKLFHRISSKDFYSLFNAIRTKFRQKEGDVDIRFDDFRKRYLKITHIQYDSLTLRNNPPKADIYFVGSDQVWAVDFFFTNARFLLDFVPKGKVKISYAPSFGKSQLESYLKPIFQRYVRSFDAVSAREESGVKIARELGIINAEKVLDPTLLLEEADYSAITESVVLDGDYLFVYILNTKPELFKKMVKIIDKQNVNQLVVKYMSTNNKCTPPQNWTKVSLSTTEFLSHIQNASYVYTNSFHGCVFSIIYKKQFTALPRDSYSDKQNLRLTNLLAMLNIDNRFVFPKNLEDLRCSTFDELIDYKSVNSILEKQRFSSLKFISDAVN